MPEYRRNFVPGGAFFLTVVVHQRYPLFRDAAARQLLRDAIQTVRHEWPFDLIAVCLLPDHIHMILSLPAGDSDYSTRVRKIKERFTTSWTNGQRWEGAVSESRQRKGVRGVWQRRFGEHTIRHEGDLKRCVDYTHWNPSKHRLVLRVRDWPFSTFHRFVEQGEYDIEWGGVDPTPNWSQPDEWGE